MDELLLEKLYAARDLFSVFESNRKTGMAISRRLDEYDELIQNRNIEERSIKHNNATAEPVSKFLPLKALLIMVVGAVVWFLLFVLVVIFNIIFKIQELDDWLNSQAADTLFIIGLIVIGSLGVLAIIITTILVIINHSSVKRKNIEDQAEYDARYKKALADHRAVTMKLIKEKEVLVPRYEEYQHNTDVAVMAFYKFLETGFVYKTYQDIVPICQFIQYLESGRCDTLEGPNGCYNLYEQELRQNTIINRLDRIESCLSMIQSNQLLMARTLMSIEATSEAMYQLACNVAETTYEMSDNIAAIRVCNEIIVDKVCDSAEVLNKISSNTEYLRR